MNGFILALFSGIHGSIMENKAFKIPVCGDIHPFVIYYNRLVRFIKTGLLLHMTTLLGLGLLVAFSRTALAAFQQQQWLDFLMYALIAGYGAVLPVFAQLDVFSRYQNYKKAKDLFHENGFKPRIANLYAASRCQRDAVKIAAQDLGLLREISSHYEQLGYRWYHILPDFLRSNPQIFLSRRYWQKTLFEKTYTSKYFLW
ncbi:hypothetical protein SAMN02746065_11513 [Desulfocicer vacuolatum DSM 3385]|uniref:Uncharacterized protein n=1 Tax=Desulfocicer vacuolatum DSM 3385 TaxID=1121400 RepID=A0A1W2D293_9BACT|nr:hypothetical protein [Desulfocicer vacuolatum]SMC91707.1 hypothetical protein SAMN02746065_11513 [Desulfocicer vacuolatum DSM 3385]